MSAFEQEHTPISAAGRAPPRPRYLRRILLTMLAQYALVSLMVGLSIAGILRTFVTPQIVAKFQAIAAALKQKSGGCKFGSAISAAEVPLQTARPRSMM